LESGIDKSLNRRGISTFISILNFLNSLRNQSDQTVLTPIDPLALSLLHSPFFIAPNHYYHYYHWIPLPFDTRPGLAKGRRCHALQMKNQCFPVRRR
jgi:hypothetical protein